MYSKPAFDPGQSSFRSICGSQLGLERFCLNFKDIATIHRNYIDPPKNNLRVNGQPALGVDMETYLGKSVNLDENYTAGTIPIKYDDIIPLKDKPGYFIAWSGEAEDSGDATTQLAANIPMYFGMMILVVIFLFSG